MFGKSFIVVSMICLGSSMAMAENIRSVYLPMIFKSGPVIRTTACLQVTELDYPQSDWLGNYDGKVDTPKNAFKAMISAARRKDKSALFKITDATQRTDKKHFDNDVEFLFELIASLKTVVVPKAYEFGSLVVFPVEIMHREKINYLIYLFSRNLDGSFTFLPYGSSQSNYVIVRDWIGSKWGSSKADDSKYCTEENIKRATHRISLSNPVTAKVASPQSSLLFTGVSLSKPEELNKFAKRVYSTIEEIKAEIKSPDSRNLDGFIKHLTPDGQKGLKEWFASTSQAELSNYKNSITEQMPFFLIDASPLVVVYTKSSLGSSQVMFFILNDNNELLWSHSAPISDSTKIFTAGSLRNASLESKPFVSNLIK